MSIINEIFNIKIKAVCLINCDVSTVDVAGRSYHALVYRVSGNALFSHNDFNSATNQGDVFYMPANYEYRAVYGEKNEIIVIHFESDINSQMENFKFKNPQLIEALFQKIYNIWNKKEYGYYFSALAIMCQIISNIGIEQNPILENGTMRAFVSAVEYMDKNYTEPSLTINDVVEKSRMSHTYFSKLFNERFNASPVDYLRTKRVLYAENLLSTGKYSVKEVAIMSGFSDEKYFSRVVKKYFGMPPSKLYKHFANQ